MNYSNPQYEVFIRQPETYEYSEEPVLIADNKNEVIKYINKKYDENEDYMFRVDYPCAITFINDRRGIEYFENRRVDYYKNVNIQIQKNKQKNKQQHSK